MASDEGSPRWLRMTGLGLGPALAAAIELSGLEPVSARHAGAVASMMAAWWMTEALPITFTAMVPLLLYPILGVHRAGLVKGLGLTAAEYVDGYIFLFMGGIALAAAMQVGSSRVDLQACKLEYSIVSPK